MTIYQKPGVIVLVISIIVLGVLYWYWDVLIPSSIRLTTPGTTIQEDITAKQLQELEALRAQLPASTKTPEQQSKELDALRKKSGSKPPSEAEISRQLEELEKLRVSP